MMGVWPYCARDLKRGGVMMDWLIVLRGKEVREGSFGVFNFDAMAYPSATLRLV
jgi:hypothetical protein